MLVEIKNISKSYKNTSFSLTGISFEIKKNEILGLVGENGTGKSTILKMIAMLESIDSGDIVFEGKSILDIKGKERRDLRKKHAYIFQENNLLLNKTVYYHLALVYKLKSEKIDNAKIDEVLNFMDLSRFKNSKCSNLSGGQAQKLSIAISLLFEPRLILCDEISSALDKTSEEEIYSLLQKIKNTKQCSVFLISHNLRVIKNYCDRVYFLKKNGKVEEVLPQKTRDEEKKTEFYDYVKEYLEK